MTMQNTSSAVMQRRQEPINSLDDFPTPPWATRALCEALQITYDGFPPGNPPQAPSTFHLTVREPAANRGHMARALGEYFHHVEASDIFDYGAGYPVMDYLKGPLQGRVDWTITNPPFRLAERFIDRALDTSRCGVAMLVRTAFLEGIGRHSRLFSQSPPSAVLQFTERVVMHKGRLSQTGSTATAYCWLVWSIRVPPLRTQLRWIAPCRKRLERASDYIGEAA
jgi:hypothetical protein